MKNEQGGLDFEITLRYKKKEEFQGGKLKDGLTFDVT